MLRYMKDSVHALSNLIRKELIMELRNELNFSSEKQI
jgi:hypothetical protein